MSNLFPVLHPNDALAISAVLEMLINNEEPPRVDVSRVHSAWLNRAPYPNGRLLVRGSTRSGPGGTPPSGFVIWYVCSRYGRAVPVRELSVSDSTIAEYDAPADQLSCLCNPPHEPDGSEDGWRDTYDAALAALTP